MFSSHKMFSVDVKALHIFEIVAIDEGLANAVCASPSLWLEIGGEKRGQPVFRIVCECDALFQIIDRLNEQDRPKDLLSHDVLSFLWLISTVGSKWKPASLVGEVFCSWPG